MSLSRRDHLHGWPSSRLERARRLLLANLQNRPVGDPQRDSLRHALASVRAEQARRQDGRGSVRPASR